MLVDRIIRDTHMLEDSPVGGTRNFFPATGLPGYMEMLKLE